MVRFSNPFYWKHSRIFFVNIWHKFSITSLDLSRHDFEISLIDFRFWQHGSLKDPHTEVKQSHFEDKAVAF